MKQITTLRELMDAAKSKRSVILNHRGYKRPVPAAWIINIIGAQLLHYFEDGMFLYEPAPKLRKFSDRNREKNEETEETKLPENKL